MPKHNWTEKQGQYLAYIYNYTVIIGEPPAEADMQHFFEVTPPTVHQMVLRLEKKGFISREPGRSRAIQVLVSPEDLPALRARGQLARILATNAPIYQLKITLNGIRPPIWRRVLVPADVTLAYVHYVIQIAMGWTNSHLHQFMVGQTCFGEPHPDYGFQMQDERLMYLGQIAPHEGFKCRYEYDFGDSWMHTLLVEKILEPEPGRLYPVCVKGRRACPLEDVGGIWGYMHFLEATSDPEHPDYPAEDLLEWAGGEFDPEAFDLEETNRILRELGRLRTTPDGLFW